MIMDYNSYILTIGEYIQKIRGLQEAEAWYLEGCCYN